MKLDLYRKPSSVNCTIGELFVDGVRECTTLEDVVRDVKILHETAIPAGTYKVILTQSNRFKRVLPLLVDVPGFSGVRIHAGNTAADTEGCILVGSRVGVEAVLESRSAFNKLFDRMTAVEGEITITIHPAGENHGT
jgi:hypothetical protein